MIEKFEVGDRVQRVKSDQRLGPRERGTIKGLKYHKDTLMVFVLWDGHHTHTWIQDNGIEHTPEFLEFKGRER